MNDNKEEIIKLEDSASCEHHSSLYCINISKSHSQCQVVCNLKDELGLLN